MTRRPKILIVARTTQLANNLVTWLRSPRCDLVVVNGFAAAKVHVDLDPDLLISELRLGEHNGLHLALRARAKSVPAVVIGDPDLVLERDAFQLGATFLHANELGRDDFLSLVEKLLVSHIKVPGRNRLAWLDDSSTFVPSEQQPPCPATSSLDAPGSRPLLH